MKRPSILLLTFSAVCCGCELPSRLGEETGVCRYDYHPDFYGGGIDGLQKSYEKWGKEMPFCGMFIANYYPPCVPKPAYIRPDRNYPVGRFANHTVREKDRWVETTVKKVIEQRILVERGLIPPDEQPPLGSGISARFYNNLDCQDAFTRYMCWINFPRCDEFEESLPTCQSACENFFRVCGYNFDFQRCSEDSGSNWKRQIKAVGNGTLYIPQFFPGQPFKANEYLPNSDGDPKAVCTPSIKGESSKISVRRELWISIAALISAWFI